MLAVPLVRHATTPQRLEFRTSHHARQQMSPNYANRYREMNKRREGREAARPAPVRAARSGRRAGRRAAATAARPEPWSLSKALRSCGYHLHGPTTAHQHLAAAAARATSARPKRGAGTAKVGTHTPTAGKRVPYLQHATGARSKPLRQQAPRVLPHAGRQETRAAQKRVHGAARRRAARRCGSAGPRATGRRRGGAGAPGRRETCRRRRQARLAPAGVRRVGDPSESPTGNNASESPRGVVGIVQDPAAPRLGFILVLVIVVVRVLFLVLCIASTSARYRYLC